MLLYILLPSFLPSLSILLSSSSYPISSLLTFSPSILPSISLSLSIFLSSFSCLFLYISLPYFLPSLSLFPFSFPPFSFHPCFILLFFCVSSLFTFSLHRSSFSFILIFFSSLCTLLFPSFISPFLNFPHLSFSTTLIFPSLLSFFHLPLLYAFIPPSSSFSIISFSLFYHLSLHPFSPFFSSTSSLSQYLIIFHSLSSFISLSTFHHVFRSHLPTPRSPPHILTFP